MSAPTYVIGFLLILTGFIGFFTQTPYLSIYPSGKFKDGLEMTLAAEDAPTLQFDYYSLGSHNDKEQAEALAEEIMAQGLGPLGEDAEFGLTDVCAQDAHAADENCHFRGGQRQHVCPIHE